MNITTTLSNEFDGPWKAALESYLQDFIELFFPQAYTDIDWTRDYQFLDTELQQIAPENAAGKLTVDKLVHFWLREGSDAWILVHIEIQSQDVVDFAQRMWQYHYRLFDRYQRQVISLAVLG